MTLFDIVPVKQLGQALDEGLVRVSGHPLGRLRIYTYTPKATRDWVWNQSTINCRGLITDTEANIVSRPYEKCFAIGTANMPELQPINFPHDEPEILEKLDGWIGIAYEAHGVRGIATKGSFTSQVARIASNIYNQKYPKSNWPAGHTPVFEIIHPLTRIVVPYDFTDLVLTGLVNIETGQHKPWKDLVGYAEDNGMRVVNKIFNLPLDKLLSETMAEPAEGREGFILKWDLGECPPLMGKLKFQEYRQAAKLVQGFDDKAIWLMLKNKQNLDGFYNTKFVPELFKERARQVTLDLEKKFTQVEKLGWQTLELCPFLYRGARGTYEFNRKYLAKWLLKHCEANNQPKQLAMLVFLMLDGKAYTEKIWDMIAPCPATSEEI